MTLRAGYRTCTAHTTQDTINKHPPNTTFIFYDIEATSAGEIRQLSAITSTGDSINLIVRTMTRKSKFSSSIYKILAEEPAAAIKHFIEWVRDRPQEELRG